MSKRYVYSLVFAAAILPFSLSAGHSQAASGVSAGTRVGNSIVVQAERGSVVLTAAPGVVKSSYSAANDIRTSALAQLVTPASSSGQHGLVRGVSPDGSQNGNTVYLSNTSSTYITPPGGSNAEMQAWFSTANYYNVPCCFNDEFKFSGSSQAVWYGSSPVNATNISLSESYQVTGISISVNVPGGFGFSGGGSTENWSQSVNNNWILNHSFNGYPDFHGAFMWDVYEYATTQCQFGSSFYSTTASDSYQLP